MRLRLRALAFTAVATTLLAACATPPPKSPWDKGPESDSKVKACLVSDQAGFSDKSFNQSAREGLEKARVELKVRIATTESSGPGDFKQNIDNLISQNCTIVFGVGFTLNDAIRKAAEDNPDLHFVLIDSRITQGNPPVPVNLPNAKALVFNTAEASFLAGYLAAGMSKTKKVGTWGGVQGPPIALFMDGFADGVARYDKDRAGDRKVTLLGWNKQTQTGSFAGGFQDQSKGKQLTQGLLSQGADIIMPVAGNAGNGALAAVKATPGTAIVWVDFDGYETTSYGSIILTSVVKDVGQGVFETIRSELSGGFDPAPYIGNLKNKGVRLAPFHDFADQVPARLKAEVAALQKGIVSGAITITTKNQP
ncbi:MAG: BMP family ABC transporter substrate-binding protein [Humibacillus sp.]|nr:BMP family ABC transporter substrate-binding protein [Humibacillus sp.]MDN5778607.1 BMP family ABC transporter substrate-binding protein [Humibacillus sp.]